MAATAATINANGLASKEWVRSEVMGVSNNEEMEQQIAKENVSKALTEYYIQKMVQDQARSDAQKLQQQEQQMQMQQQRNQEAMQRDMMEVAQQQNGYDMGGAQNIPVGAEQANPRLAAIQAQAMANNIPQGNEPQVPEGNLSPTAGVAGGMPSEMMGMIPQMGA